MYIMHAVRKLLSLNNWLQLEFKLLCQTIKIALYIALFKNGIMIIIEEVRS